MPHKDPATKKAYQSNYYRNHRQESKKRKDRWLNANPRKILWRNAKKRAKDRGLEFSIEESDIDIPEVCPVFKVPLVLAHGKGRKGYNPAPNTPTLDRIDNTKGYIKGNVWVISWHANRLKNDATLDELKQVVSALESQLASSMPVV
jgi:hypothetical protein